jgi:hypothetical protein
MTTTALRATPLDPHHADLVKAALDRLDHTAHEAERKWGIGRLRLLVDDVLRAKFDRQAKLLDEALWGGNASGHEILAQIDAMERGWRRLDQVAGEAGHVPKPPTWLEATGPGGKLFILVTDTADAYQISDHARGRQATVFTASEIGRLLEAWPAIATAKQHFEGAQVVELRARRPVDWDKGDDIPW